jgi:hypothetical protein
MFYGHRYGRGPRSKSHVVVVGGGGVVVRTVQMFGHAGPTRMAGYHTLTASEMSMLTATAGDASNDSSRCTSFDLAAWMRASAIVRSHALFAHTHIHIPLDS